MGPNSPQTTQQSQSSVSAPWTAAQPLLQNLIDSYSGQSTAVTPAQQAGATALTTDTSGIPNEGSAATGAVNNAFNFSTAPQTGMLSDSLKSLQTNLNPTATGANLNPWNTPGFGDAMGLLNKNITNQVGNSYAASGREPSGAGTEPETLARGLSEGEGGLIQSQYNQNEQNLLGANSTLFNAGNAAASGEAGLGALGINTGLTGVSATPGATAAYALPGSTQLNAASTAYQTPWTNLAALLQPAATIGSLGGQTSSSGTSTTTPANNMLSNIIGGVGAGAGLLSASGAGGSAGWLAPLLLASDVRLKTDIEPVGKLNDGQTVHRFRYKGRPEMHMGLLAQEVQKKNPGAVGKINSMGMLGVDYAKATDRAAEMKEAA